MKAKFQFKIGNRGLLEGEVGLADRMNARLRASAVKHRIELNEGALVKVTIARSGTGKIVRRAGSEDNEPVEVPLAAA